MVCKNSPRVYDDIMIHIADQFSQHRRVAFADTDASGRVHFTAILRYVEDAEHAYLAEKGITVISANGGWPRVHVQCDYRAPLAFGDEVTTIVRITKVGSRSVEYAFIVSKNDQLCAEGTMVIVRVGG